MRLKQAAFGAALASLLLAPGIGLTAPQYQSRWLEAAVDHSDSGVSVMVLHDAEGWFYLRRLDALLLELPLREAPLIRFEDEWYLRIDALDQHRLVLDEVQGRAIFLSPAAATQPAGRSQHAVSETAASSVQAAKATPQAPAILPSAPAPASPPTPIPAPVPTLQPAPVEPQPGETRPLTVDTPDAADQVQSPPDTDSEELLLDVIVNGQAIPGVWLLKREGSELWIDAELLGAAGIRIPDGATASDVVALSTLSDERYTLDRAALSLSLSVPAEAFEGHHIDMAKAFVAGAPPPDFSAIFGYDLDLGYSDGELQGGALMDMALARGRFSCATSALWRSERVGLRHLESACHVDWPERTLSLTLGDGVARGGPLQPAVRFSGLRFGTAFELNPYYRTLPDLSLSGSARLPSTLEVWIDQQLALRTDLAPGPFDIRDIPAHSGSGELRAVVTDALGRQTVIGSPVFLDARLLRPGLLDWALEIGRLRIGYLQTDERAGDTFAAFGARRGISSQMTGEFRAELREDGAGLGLGSTWQSGRHGLLELGLAASQDDAGSGHAWHAGYSYRGKRFSLGFRQTRHSRQYTSLAYPDAGEAPARISQANVGVPVRNSQLNVGYIDRQLHDGQQQRFVHAGLSLRPFGTASMIVSLTQQLGGERDTSIGLFLSVPLSSNRSAFSSLRHAPDTLQVSAGVQRGVPAGIGYGYRVGAHYDQSGTSLDFNGIYRHSNAEFGILGRSGPGGGHLRANLSGSVVLGQGGVHLARREAGSYGLVRLGFPGVRIYRDNQVVAITNAQGQAMIPGLRPFERNLVHLAVDDLPLATSIQTDSLELVPGRRQAVLAEFAVLPLRYLSTRLVLPDGGHPPAGANVRVEGLNTLEFVGFKGEVFLQLPNLEQIRVLAEWNGHRCSANTVLHSASEDIIEIDSLPCEEP